MSGQHVILTAFGETPLDAVEHHLVLAPQDLPSPETLGPRDVVIAVKSAAVGWVDLLMSSGQYQHAVSPPYTPGLEYAGVVHWVGAEVDRVAVGDRVLADGFRTGPRSKGAHQTYGGFATYAVAPAEAVLPLPERLGFDQACNLLGNYETAYHCLIHRGRLQAGETVLIHGASGATGLAAVHIAKHLGATVIATGRSAEKLEVELREFGSRGQVGVVRALLRAPGLRVNVADRDTGNTPLHEAMRHGMFPGGKRLRPVLGLLGCQVTGGAVERALRPSAAGVSGRARLGSPLPRPRTCPPSTCRAKPCCATGTACPAASTAMTVTGTAAPLS